VTRKAHLGKMNAGRSKHPFVYREFLAERFRRQSWVWLVSRIKTGSEARR
jgi:hypothetical protein